MAKKQAGAEVKPAAQSAEEKALNNTLSQIEKTFGAGAIMKLGEGSHLEVEGISTGALSLDLALGGKGLPAGPDHRDVRPGVERQDDDRPARGRQRPADRRRRGVHRRRARARPVVVQEARA